MTQFNKSSTKFQEIVLHFVLTPKYRLQVLHGEIAQRLAEHIYQVCDELGVEILALAIQPDHVHLLVVLPRQLDVATFMNRVKGRSSCLLRREFPHLVTLAPKALWGRDYFVRSVGGGRKAVRKYVSDQMHNA